MKKLLISALTLFCVNSTTAFAEEESAEALLYQMNEASQHLNYELSYILVKKNSIEPCCIVMHGKMINNWRIWCT